MDRFDEYIHGFRSRLIQLLAENNPNSPKLIDVFNSELNTLDAQLKELLTNSSEDESKDFSSEVSPMKQENQLAQQVRQVSEIASLPIENPNPVLRISQEGILLFINAAGKAVLGKSDWEIGSPVPDEWQQHVLKAVRNRKLSTFTITLKNRDYLFTVSPAASKGYANLYGQEITEYVQNVANLIEENRIQNELLDKIFEASPIGVAVVGGPELRYEMLNPAYPSLVPYPEKAVKGARMIEAVPPHEGYKSYTYVEKVIQSGQIFSASRDERTYPDGSNRIFSFHLVPLEWKDYPAVLLLVWDTTEQEMAFRQAKENEQAYLQAWEETQRRAAEAEEGRLALQKASEGLREAEAKIKAILSSIIESYFLVDHDWRFIEVNQHALDYMEKQAEDLLGKNLWEVYHQLNGTEIQEKLITAMREHRPTHFEVKSVTVPRWAEIHTYPVKEGLAVYFSDITSRKEAEEALLKSNQRLQSVLESITEAYFTIDRDWRIIDLNPVAQREYFKRSREELIGKIYHVEYPQTIGNEFWRQYHHAFETGKPVHFEAKSGVVNKWYEAHAYPYEDRLDIYLHDIDDRKRTEQELERLVAQLNQERSLAEQRAEELEAFIYSMTDAVFIFNADKTEVKYNPAASRYLDFELTSGEAPNLFGTNLRYPDQKPVPAEETPLARAFRGETVTNQRLIVDNHEGSDRIFFVSASPIYVKGNMTGVVMVGKDVTEQERIEHALIESSAQVETQRLLMNHREMERQEIARDLHDGPLQDLIAINFNLMEALEIEDKEQRLARFEALQSLVQKGIQDLRSFCNELRPPALVPFGLERAIRSHLETFHMMYPDLHVELHLMKDGKLLPEETRLAFFRIFQELLNNVAKHAKATQVDVTFSYDEEQIVLEVVDNGIGFEMPYNWVSLAREGHLGLVGVRERAEAVGGKVKVISAPGKGTHVKVTASFTPAAAIVHSNP